VRHTYLCCTAALGTEWPSVKIFTYSTSASKISCKTTTHLLSIISDTQHCASMHLLITQTATVDCDRSLYWVNVHSVPTANTHLLSVCCYNDTQTYWLSGLHSANTNNNIPQFLTATYLCQGANMIASVCASLCVFVCLSVNTRDGPNVRLWHSAEAKGLGRLTVQVPNVPNVRPNVIC